MARVGNLWPACLDTPSNCQWHTKTLFTDHFCYDLFTDHLLFLQISFIFL